MKLIQSSYSILEQKPGLDGIYEQIEIAGRTCYRSQRPEGQTARGFVDRMVASQHYAMLEHGTVYLLMPVKYKTVSYSGISKETYSTHKYNVNPYSKVIYINFTEKVPDYIPVNIVAECDNMVETEIAYITTNYRVLVENGWLDDLKYLCEPTEFHEKRITVRFTTDRGVSHKRFVA